MDSKWKKSVRLASVQKQFNKTTQRISERVVKGSKSSDIDEEILELGKKLDIVNKWVPNIQTKTKEFLQPNPSARTKLAMKSSYQAARGQTSTAKYPQPEENLAMVFSSFGGRLIDPTPYAVSLEECGAAFRELARTKERMEMKVAENFLKPLNDMQRKELKEISMHRKKLEGRRLDYDFKKNKGEKVTAEELEAAQTKFTESKALCLNSMQDFMENEVEHISQLLELAQCVRDYHEQCALILESLTENLSARIRQPGMSVPKESSSGSGLKLHWN